MIKWVSGEVIVRFLELIVTNLELRGFETIFRSKNSMLVEKIIVLDEELAQKKVDITLTFYTIILTFNGDISGLHLFSYGQYLFISRKEITINDVYEFDN